MFGLDHGLVCHSSAAKLLRASKLGFLSQQQRSIWLLWKHDASLFWAAIMELLRKERDNHHTFLKVKSREICSMGEWFWQTAKQTMNYKSSHEKFFCVEYVSLDTVCYNANKSVLSIPHWFPFRCAFCSYKIHNEVWLLWPLVSVKKKSKSQWACGLWWSSIYAQHLNVQRLGFCLKARTLFILLCSLLLAISSSSKVSKSTSVFCRWRTRLRE